MLRTTEQGINKSSPVFLVDARMGKGKGKRKCQG